MSPSPWQEGPSPSVSILSHFWPTPSDLPSNWSELVGSDAAARQLAGHIIASRTKCRECFLILLHSIFPKSVQIRFIMANRVNGNRTILFLSSWKISQFSSPYPTQMPWFGCSFELSTALGLSFPPHYQLCCAYACLSDGTSGGKAQRTERWQEVAQAVSGARDRTSHFLQETAFLIPCLDVYFSFKAVNSIFKRPSNFANP